mgnify:CR=1 FL=1
MNLLELGIYLLYQNFYKRICVILYDSYSNDSGGLSGFNSGFIRILRKFDTKSQNVTVRESLLYTKRLKISTKNYGIMKLLHWQLQYKSYYIP